jgi:hypothetical protein
VALATATPQLQIQKKFLRRFFQKAASKIPAFLQKPRTARGAFVAY